VGNGKDKFGYEIFGGEGHGLFGKMNWWMKNIKDK